jgi:hypothetical protein
MVDFDLLIEIPLDTDSIYFITFLGRCMHSLPLCYSSEVVCGTCMAMFYFQRISKSVKKERKGWAPSMRKGPSETKKQISLHVDIYG